MHLTYHSDYALRLLIYLTADPDRLVSTEEVSKAYNISRNHLVRVAQTLHKYGFVKLYPGRKGGIKLAQEPKNIKIGDVLRHTEPNFDLVECFNKEKNSCPIVPICGLKSILFKATEAFLDTLGQYTLADIIKTSDQDSLPTFFLTSTLGQKPTIP